MAKIDVGEEIAFFPISIILTQNDVKMYNLSIYSISIQFQCCASAIVMKGQVL